MDPNRYTYENLKKNGRILFESIVGSHSYGLNVPESDIDKKFIYIAYDYDVLIGDFPDEVRPNDDFVGYEISKCLKQLGKNSPNIAEIAFADSKFIQFCHPLFQDLIINNKEEFLSRKVAFSYGAYAHSQIKKAQTTSKKFLNPQEGPRKELIDFSYVLIDNKSIPLKNYIENNELDINYLAVSRMNHAKDMYSLFIDETKSYTYGVFGKNGVDIKLMNLPKGLKHLAHVMINIDGFSVYCKEYAEYQEWISKRNVVRFAENLDNEHKYDRKNMMHCHRLLNMCIEILEGKGINVLRSYDREYLLGIRYGKATYQELVDSANEKKLLIEGLYKKSNLQDEVDFEFLNHILFEFRTEI